MYDPTIGRFLSMDPPSANGVDMLYPHPFEYAQNNPANRIDPSGRQAVGAPARPGKCMPKEVACIDQAKKLAIDILKRNRVNCFNLVLRRCRSECTSEELTDCAIAVLERTAFHCEPPDPAHKQSRGRTEGLCAFFKDLAARGWNLSWGQLRTCPLPCISPIPNGANCSLCLDKAPIALILYRFRTGKDGIDKYCPASVRELANLLVHEATHNCVGGHATTNPGGIPLEKITAEDPTCDVCGRPDTEAIEKAFAKCR